MKKISYKLSIPFLLSFIISVLILLGIINIIIVVYTRKYLYNIRNFCGLIFLVINFGFWVMLTWGIAFQKKWIKTLSRILSFVWLLLVPLFFYKVKGDFIKLVRSGNVLDLCIPIIIMVFFLLIPIYFFCVFNRSEKGKINKNK
jgi:hypothetical protein